MRLGCEVAAGGRAVPGVDAEVGQQRVAGVAEHLQVAALVGVAVVVDPVGPDTCPVQCQRLRQVIAVGHRPGVGAVDQRVLGPRQRLPGADAVGAQCQQHVHQAVVAHPLQLGGGHAAGESTSDWATILSISSSVSSGTSVSFVQGHFNDGPNWAMKWRMPFSPPAIR